MADTIEQVSYAVPTVGTLTVWHGGPGTWCGMQVSSMKVLENFWRVVCPCGVEVHYPINGFPTVDTPHPCGKPEHWTVRFDNATEG